MAWYRHVFAKIVIAAVASIALPCFIGSAHATDYTMNITTSGSRSINVSPRADGVGTSISADNINVQTTCRAGYNLTVSTSVDNNNLYLDGDIANNASGAYFSPASGSSTLKNSPNTWGYLVSDTAPNENSTFSPVPALGTTATIKTPVSSTADIDDHFNVYYGVSVANGMNTGTYKMIPDTSVTPNKDGAIVYYLTMADACTSYTVHYNPTGADNNGVLRTGTGTMTDQLIKENIATNLTANTFTAPNGYYFAGWNTAQDGSGTSYTDGQSVTNLENATIGDTITLYAQWTDCQGGYVCYNSNGATGPIVSGNVAAIANQSVSGTATAVTLRAQNFYRTNYGFLGWSTIQLDPDDANFASDFANATAAGKVYGPNETLTITAGQYSSGGLRLYAVWLPKSTSYTMQTFGATQCASELTKIVYAQDAASNSGVSFSTENQSNITLDSFIALQDARDTNVYTVARLTDGNCWMLENLRLDNTNTDNSTGALAQGYHSDSTYGNFVGLADPETADFANSTTANSLYYSGTQSGTATVDIGTTNNPDYRMPRYNKNNTGSTVASSTGSGNTYGYGNYYTWAAAMANTTYYSSATATDADGKTSETVNTSICPKGWSLPYGRSSGNGVTSGGFSYLSTSMGGSSRTMDTSSTPTGAVMSNRLRQFPNNFIYSGYWGSSSAGERGSFGYYWSSTAYSPHLAFYLYFGSSYVYPGTLYYNDYGKYNGRAVRCLAQ